MVRKQSISQSDKGLVDRIFALFSDEKINVLAEKLEKSPSVVSGWKTGISRPTLDDLRKIIEITGVSWEELMTGQKPQQMTGGGENKEQQMINEARSSRIERVKYVTSHSYSDMDYRCCFPDGRIVLAVNGISPLSQKEWDRLCDVYSVFRAYMRTGQGAPMPGDYEQESQSAISAPAKKIRGA